MQIFLRRADIVEEAGNQICFGGERPGWEVGAEDGYSCERKGNVSVVD